MSIHAPGARVIDWRSDTVTRPTPAMREAMMAAEVGDDVFGDDPTVNRLQARVAEQAGFEAALFMASGTQSNLCALMSHCQRGDEYIVGQMAHTYRWEGGGAAVLGSIQPQPLAHQPDGTLSLSDIAEAVKPDDAHFARSRLLALENTLGGKVIPQDYMVQAAELARAKGLKVHLDGARLFNAQVATGLPLATLCQPFDSVSLCFSKGLGAPVGSVLCGSKAFIREAHKWRKMTGGGLRQAGLLAAAALHALDHHVERLAQDHALARQLAAGLATIPGLRVEVPQTNIVFVDVDSRVPEAKAKGLLDHLRGHGILATGLYRLRFVAHLDVTPGDADRTVDVLRAYLQD